MNGHRVQGASFSVIATFITVAVVAALLALSLFVSSPSLSVTVTVVHLIPPGCRYIYICVDRVLPRDVSSSLLLMFSL